MRPRSLFVFVTILIIFSNIVSGQINKVELAKISDQVGKATPLTGKEYINARDELVKLYIDKPEYFSELASKHDDWRIRLLSLIVIERAQKKEDVEKFLAWKPDVPLPPIRDKRIEYIGRAIAEHGNTIPMLIVEGFWKENELTKKTFSKTEAHFEYLAYAIGILKIGEAREMLQDALGAAFYEDREIAKRGSDKWYDFVREQVAVALGTIGDSQSVPALIGVIEDIGDNIRKYSKTRVAVATALLQCMDRDSLPYLKESIARTKVTWIKKFLEETIKRLNRGSGLGDVKKDRPIIPRWKEDDTWEVIFESIPDVNQPDRIVSSEKILFKVLKVDPLRERIAVIALFRKGVEIYRLDFYYDDKKVWLGKVVEKGGGGQTLKEYLNQSSEWGAFMAVKHVKDIILDFPSFPAYQTHPYTGRKDSDSIQITSAVRFELSNPSEEMKGIVTKQEWEKDKKWWTTSMRCVDSKSCIRGRLIETE